MVYTAAAGIDPQTVLPVVLDCGSNRESLLKDPSILETVTRGYMVIIIMIS